MIYLIAYLLSVIFAWFIMRTDLKMIGADNTSELELPSLGSLIFILIIPGFNLVFSIIGYWIDRNELAKRHGLNPYKRFFKL